MTPCEYCQQEADLRKSHLCGGKMVHVCAECWTAAAAIEGARDAGWWILTTETSGRVSMISVGDRKAIERSGKVLTLAGFSVKIHNPTHQGA